LALRLSQGVPFGSLTQPLRLLGATRTLRMGPTLVKVTKPLVAKRLPRSRGLRKQSDKSGEVSPWRMQYAERVTEDLRPEEEDGAREPSQVVTALAILAVMGGFVGGIVLGMTIQPWGLGFGLALVSLFLPFVVGVVRLPGRNIGPPRERWFFLIAFLLLLGATGYALYLQNDIAAILVGFAALIAFAAWHSRR
jgi:hypothetical protein